MSYFLPFLIALLGAQSAPVVDLTPTSFNESAVPSLGVVATHFSRVGQNWTSRTSGGVIPMRVTCRDSVQGDMGTVLRANSGLDQGVFGISILPNGKTLTLDEQQGDLFVPDIGSKVNSVWRLKATSSRNWVQQGAMISTFPSWKFLTTSVFAKNESSSGPDVVDRKTISIPKGFGYVNQLTTVTTQNPSPPTTRYSITDGFNQGPDGRINGLWFKATAGFKDSFGAGIWVGAQLRVLVVQGVLSPIAPGVKPPPPNAPKIASFTVSPASVTAGAPVTFTINLDKPAPSGGFDVGISSVTVDGITDAIQDIPFDITFKPGVQQQSISLKTIKVVPEATTIYIRVFCGKNDIVKELTIH